VTPARERLTCGLSWPPMLDLFSIVASSWATGEKISDPSLELAAACGGGVRREHKRPHSERGCGEAVSRHPAASLTCEF
jgi:hypothetical protein